MGHVVQDYAKCLAMYTDTKWSGFQKLLLDD
jgi:hypothetical protein